MLDLKALLTKMLQTSSVVGEIKAYAGSTVPNGWLICDGSAISRTDYPLLFNAIGTLWGVGDGSTTFNLPNLKGKVPVGYDSSQTEFDTVGEAGGALTHYHTTGDCTLTSAQSGVPAHAHGNTFKLSNNSQLIYSTDAVGATRGTINTSSSASTSFIKKTYNASGTAGLRTISLSGGVSNNTAANASSAHNHGNTQTVSNLQPYAVVKYIICAI